MIPARRASCTSVDPTPPLAPRTTIVAPPGTFAVRCSICQAVTPLTTTVSASAAVTPSGTGTRSAASSSRKLAQAPVLVTAANRRPIIAVSTSGPVATTVPTTS
ncbi:hypothetical protein ABZW30_26685 [Kitasatospora sp. NPDC004669]|uniref:zinc finger domain-containing protein n=1 Tax=Kitasatospora sp. NPDC004669 TaxID=3154555 RepID=UPI0033B6F97C